MLQSNFGEFGSKELFGVLGEVEASCILDKSSELFGLNLIKLMNRIRA